MAPQKEQVAILGSGNWCAHLPLNILTDPHRGSAIAKIAGINVLKHENEFHSRVPMWVFEEQVSSPPIALAAGYSGAVPLESQR